MQVDFQTLIANKKSAHFFWTVDILLLDPELVTQFIFNLWPNDWLPICIKKKQD